MKTEIRVTRDSSSECRYSRLKRLFGGKGCKRGEIEEGWSNKESEAVVGADTTATCVTSLNSSKWVFSISLVFNNRILNSFGTILKQITQSFLNFSAY